jgi:hypothetical protein
MLSEARKHGLGLVLANQYFHQLVGDTLEAVEGNVGAFCAFETGENDARALALYMKPEFTAADLVSLGKYRAAISLRVGGSRQPAFSLETLPPPEEGNLAVGHQREAALRQRSVAQYTPRSYSEVLRWLNHRYAPDKSARTAKPPSPTTKKDKGMGGDDEFIEPQ